MNIRTTNVATRKSEDLIENGGVFHAPNSHCVFQQQQQQHSCRQTVLFAWVDNSHIAVPVCVRALACVHVCECVRSATT